MSDNKKQDYNILFKSEAGERVLADLMDTFHMSHSSHVSSDSHETAFREGERHVILHILDKLGKRTDAEWFTGMADKAASQYSRAEFTYET